MLYLQLFWEFFKTGLFAIGGGMATLPFLYDMADKTGWFTRAQLADMIAVSESTPGPIGVNMATYVGFLTGGVPGAVTATVGLIAPSVIVILIVAAFLQEFRASKYVAGAFYGLRPASTALITAAGLVVVRETFWLTGGVLFWQGIILAAVLEELPEYKKLKKCSVFDYVPEWKKREEEGAKRRTAGNRTSAAARNTSSAPPAPQPSPALGKRPDMQPQTSPTEEAAASGSSCGNDSMTPEEIGLVEMTCEAILEGDDPELEEMDDPTRIPPGRGI